MTGVAFDGIGAAMSFVPGAEVAANRVREHLRRDRGALFDGDVSRRIVRIREPEPVADG